MNERPLLFKAAMVRAILDGRKTQTRRMLKPQPSAPRFIYQPEDSRAVHLGQAKANRLARVGEAYGFCWQRENISDGAMCSHICPQGSPGDRLWVKETFFHVDDFHGRSVTWYRADGEAVDRWKPSIFMPRKASRITLEITGIRVERLNDISEEDALAEGIRLLPGGGYGVDEPFSAENTARDAYRVLWESINGAGSWARNEWVWPITFFKL